MKVNVGIPDRMARAALSLALLALALKRNGRLGVISAFIAGDVMGSAVSGYCPLYSILGISTAGKVAD